MTSQTATTTTTSNFPSFMQQAFEFARNKAESGEWSWDQAWDFVKAAKESENKSEAK